MLLIQSYNINVPGSRGAWTPGPYFEYGESLRIQASGAIQWGGLGPVPVASIPPAFTGAPTTVNFTIPAGTWLSATWELQGNYSGGSIATLSVKTGGAHNAAFPDPSASPFDTSVAATTLQLADINAAAGGTLASVVLDVTSGGTTVNFTSFVLTLVGTPATYALPEGGYPPYYPSSHAYDPTSVLQNGSWTGGALPATNSVPISLVGIILPDGLTPALMGWGSNVLQPNQDALYGPLQLAAAGANIAGPLYRLWLLFNDASASFPTNSGSFACIIGRYASAQMANEPLVSLLRPQVGVEAPGGYGAGTVATRILNFIENGAFDLNPDQTKEDVNIAGIAFDTDEVITTEMSKGSAKGKIEYRDFGYPLSCIYGIASDSLISSSAGVSAYRHVWIDEPFVPINFQSYYLEAVKDGAQRAYNTSGLMFAGMKIDTDATKQHTVSYTILAKSLADGISPSVGQNDVQLITFNGGPGTGGTWNLILDTLILYNLAGNITAANLQIAIRTLGGIWALATVTGTAGTNYTVTNVTGVLVPTFAPVYVNGAGSNTLLPNTATITVTHTTPGGMLFDLPLYALNGQLSVSFAPDLPTLVNSPTIITDEFQTAIDVTDRFEPTFRQNTADINAANVPTNSGVVQKKASDLKDTVKLVAAYNAQMGTFISNSRSGTKMFVKIKSTGGLIGLTGQSFTMVYECAAVVKWDTFGDTQNNIHTVSFTLKVIHDLASGFRNRWTIINDIPNYAT